MSREVPPQFTGTGPLLDALNAGTEIRLVPGPLDAPCLGCGPLETLRSLLARVVYKPGWWFEVQELPNWGPDLLLVHYQAPDAYNPAGTRDQVFQATVPPSSDGDVPDEERWLAWLFAVISYLEVHEAAEFLTLGGVRVFDPHADEQAAANRLAYRGLPRYV